MRIFKDKDGNVISAGAFELDGISFPANWLDLANDEDLAARSITVETQTDPEPIESPPAPEPTPAERLEAAIGLTPTQLKQLLASV